MSDDKDFLKEEHLIGNAEREPLVGTSEEERLLIEEKIANKRRKKWISRGFTLLFVAFCAIVFGVGLRIAFILSGDVIMEKLGDKVPEVREQATLFFSDDTPTPKPSPTNIPISTNTPTPAVSPTPKPTVEIAVNQPTTGPAEGNETGEPVSVPDGGVKEEDTDPEVTPSPEPDDPNHIALPTAAVLPTTIPEHDYKTEYSYTKFMEEVRETAAYVNNKICYIDAVTVSMDWFGTKKATRSSTTGLFIADNGIEYLILADYSAIKGAESYEVRLSDANPIEVSLYGYDSDYSLAILSLPKKNIPEQVADEIELAVLLEDEKVENGIPLLAIGKPNGYEDSLVCGIVTGEGKSPVLDGCLKYILTDWQYVAKADGFAFDMQGYAVGMISTSALEDNNANITSCVTLAHLRGVLDKLINRKKLVEFGVFAEDVPNEVKLATAIEKGVFVNEVASGSPAFQAGLRNTDIIVRINGEDIDGVEELMDLLGKASVSQGINVGYMRMYDDGAGESSAYVILVEK